MKSPHLRNWAIAVGVVLYGGLRAAGLAFPGPAEPAYLILSENFEDGLLDSRISIQTTGSFTSTHGIKDVSAFGSTKAFGFGRSTCGANCFNNYVTVFKVTLPAPTFISAISFKEMELFDNWGSDGTVLVDGSPLTTSPNLDFGRLPYNDRVADTTYRSKVFSVNKTATTIELRVGDITYRSEIFIDDVEVFGELPAACYSTHTSGSGATRLQFCVSQWGTLGRFESPASFEHIESGPSGEGYALCSNSGVHGFEAGIARAGFGSPAITQPKGPNTLPLTITRTTSDGIFQLKQTFTRDTAEYDVTVIMAVKNLSSVAQTNVRLSRYVHGALDNGAGNEEYGTTADSVWGRDLHGLMLTALTSGTVHTTAVEAFGDWNPVSSGGTGRGCDATAQPTPTDPGDFVERVTYSLGTIKAGGSKTVKTVYRRF